MKQISLAANGFEIAPTRMRKREFRDHLLEASDLSLQLLAAINALLATKDLLLQSGIVVDATLIAAPPLTKNRTGERDPEMQQTKKGNQRHFGMKAHIGDGEETTD